MKYKLLKPLPDIDSGTIIEYKDDKYFFESWSEVHAEFNDIFYRIFHRDSKDWYEEVKEKKSIYDLEEWDEYYLLDSILTIWKYKITNEWHFYKNEHINNFTTEREARRNKLLRELATREKWLPDKLEHYIDINWSFLNWHKNCIINYHMWFIFRSEEEYKKWITPEAQDLLFKI